MSQLALSSRKKHKHKDLQCPFDLRAAMKTNVVNFTRADRHKRVIATVFHSSLPAKERAAVKDIEALGMDAPQAVKPCRRAPVTNLTDEEKENVFLEYMDNVHLPSPKSRSDHAEHVAEK
ncbi:hypothetical protein [Pseudomonas sp. SED1]|uniref:hypothetical protein n=1 Tax=Pseudomonas sp. SED1 TaxID=3056845 RepID=UPI00296FB4DC|nr:hypothetical protein [Pseudomonas sp. SED1]MDY0835282.1 hypothetical protein [Pseudomonas sp. SED1]